MRADADGFVYFADRMGETFRFKGENVSTAEVAAVVGALSRSIEHCLVYGVSLPHVDGKVGMAALLLCGDEAAGEGGEGRRLDFRALYAGLDAQLPHYAQPRFVRLLSSAAGIELTSTFKPKKARLVAEGIAPPAAAGGASAGGGGSGDGDAVYYRDAAARTFVALDDAARERIANGTFAL